MTDQAESDFLAAYQPGRYPPMAVTVDVVLLTLRAGRFSLLLVRRRGHPEKGKWALPGGFVMADEDLQEAAIRELKEETGIEHLPEGMHLEQLRTYGTPGRDPRMRVVSVAYVALIAHGGRFPPRPAGDKYAAVAWRPVRGLPGLAYDHAAVVTTAAERLRAKLAYTNLVYTLLPREFTLGELQEMYEAILGRGLDRRNFRKKILALRLLRPVGRERRGPHRPAALYAFRHRRPMVIQIL